MNIQSIGLTCIVGIAFILAIRHIIKKSNAGCSGCGSYNICTHNRNNCYNSNIKECSNRKSRNKAEERKIYEE